MTFTVLMNKTVNFLNCKITSCSKFMQIDAMKQEKSKCFNMENILFLVGAFSFKEKSPTITVASFFFFFFRQTTELIAYVPLFTETDKFTQAKFHQCKLTAKGPPFVFYLFYVTYKTGRLQRVPPFNFFSALCEFFFRKFLVFQKSPPFGFLIFCNRKYVNESQRVPRFHFSALCDVFEVFFKKKFFKKIFQKNFQKFFCFQSRKVVFQSYRA